MSDAIEAALTAYRETATYPIVPGNHSEAMRAALTAYEAAKGGGVGAEAADMLDEFDHLVHDEIGALIGAYQWVKNIADGTSTPADALANIEKMQTALIWRWDALKQPKFDLVSRIRSALTSPASGSGTREEIKGAVGRETEGWPAETDHVPSPASGERDAPQCCMCGKNGLSTTEGDGGAECELADGRWVCSQACYDKAVPMPGGERDAVIDYTKAAERLLRARPFGDATIGKYLGLEDNYHSTAVMARALAAALRMEGSAVTASDESDE